jgi:hypothetical protein
MEAYFRMQHAGLQADRATYNPLLSALWASGQFALAEDLMLRALAAGLYPRSFNDTPSLSLLDLHNMSAGAAAATLSLWCSRLRERHVGAPGGPPPAPPPQRFHIVTGWGKHSRRLGVSEVKLVVIAALAASGSPFTGARHNVGMLQAAAPAVLAWLRATTVRDLRTVFGGDGEASGRTLPDTASAHAARLRSELDERRAAGGEEEVAARPAAEAAERWGTRDGGQLDSHGRLTSCLVESGVVSSLAS